MHWHPTWRTTIFTCSQPCCLGSRRHHVSLVKGGSTWWQGCCNPCFKVTKGCIRFTWMIASGILQGTPQTTQLDTVNGADYNGSTRVASVPGQRRACSTGAMGWSEVQPEGRCGDHFVTAGAGSRKDLVKLLKGWDNRGMAPLKELRQAAGKLSWLSGNPCQRHDGWCQYFTGYCMNSLDDIVIRR